MSDDKRSTIKRSFKEAFDNQAKHKTTKKPKLQEPYCNPFNNVDNQDFFFHTKVIWGYLRVYNKCEDALITNKEIDTFKQYCEGIIVDTDKIKNPL
jgi:hypothetical protein